MSPKLAKPPKAYERFRERYPRLGEAWDKIAEGGEQGPLDARVVRLVKLGIAIGAMREGSVHSAVRKALAAGASEEELRQVVALAAGTLGLPSTVAVDDWVDSEIRKVERRGD